MEDDDFEIGSLLGASIRAIQDAQISAERAYLEFLLEYGVEEVDERRGAAGGLRLREVAFDMTRHIADPSSPGRVVETTATVRAPLLSLVQMPAIGIGEATVEFDLDVETDVEASKKAADAANGRPAAFGLAAVRAARPLPVLKGAVGGASRTKSRRHGKLKVKLTLRATNDDDLHGRIVRLIGEGVSATVETPEGGSNGS